MVLLGEPGKAKAYYEEGLQACERIHFRPEIALVRLAQANLIIEQYPDEIEAARGHLSFAISEFTNMSMQPALERATEVQERLGLIPKGAGIPR